MVGGSGEEHHLNVVMVDLPLPSLPRRAFIRMLFGPDKVAKVAKVVTCSCGERCGVAEEEARKRELWVGSRRGSNDTILCRCGLSTI